MLLDRLKATGRIFALFLGVFALSAAAQAGPEDGRIVNGSGSISQSGTHTDIRQNSDFLATHWGSFNIAAHESVQAHQPDASSRLLIRVDGGAATNIAGNYTSNGITILENRNGVQFSRGAIVNVGGLLATSSRISGVSGANWQLNGTGGAVVNHGQIAAGAGGVVLAAVRVENHGKITAQGGDVSLGAGSAFTVDFAGSLVGFEVKKAADGASVVHDGVIESQGGIVSLSAQEAQAVRTNVVSVGGVVKATRIERRGGVVYLSGGTQGIAEVSGDVSASRKVQTTGEYVVVKEGALLKAPEILVGGDFQGGGDVQTAKRTLVERGALLNAGAEGRVIVWSDETTWFNGDISAPGGFAEVSGKETLASVHLAGIDVGELLLDPADIIIAASGTGVAVTASIAADADPPGTLTLDVDDINTFAGALSLAASDTIMVDGEILKPTGDLTLIAGGVLTLGANITTSAGDLALTGASMALSGAATLTGGAITITAPTINIDTHALTITASGALTLDTVGMITGTGTAALSLEGDTIAGLSTALTLDVPTVSLTLTLAAMLDFSGVVLVPGSSFGATAPFAANSNIGTLNLAVSTPQTYHTWMAAEDRNLSIDATGFVITIGVAEIDLGAGNLALSARVHDYTHASGLTIRVGDFSHSGGFEAADQAFISTPLRVFADGNIMLETRFVLSNRLELRADNDGDGMGMITSSRSLRLDAGSLILQQAGEFAADLFPTTSVVPGAATFLITGMGVDQTIHPWMASLGGTSFSLRGDGVVLDSITLPAAGVLTSTGDIDLQATSIILSSNTVLTGGDISLTGAIDESATSPDTSGIGGGDNLTIIASGVLTLNDNINLGTGDLVINATGGTTLGGVIELTADDITLTGDITSVSNALTITAATSLNLNSDINTGTGNLTLDVGSTGGTFTGVRMLSGNVVIIGGTEGILADGDLTISAGGNLMVNTNISLGSGATTVLRLEAGRGMGQTGDISFSSNTLELRASRFFLTQNGAVFGNVRPVAFQDEAGMGLGADATELITRITYDGTETQAEVDWANILPNTVSRGPGGTGDYAVPAADFVSGVLAAAVSITLDAGTGVLTFAATGDITLRAPTITITAGTIDLGADRTLTLTAETGTLTLNFTAATTITGTVTGMGTAGLTVIAEDIAFSGTAPILNVPEVSLTLTLAATTDSSGRVLMPGSSFGATAPFSPDSTIGTLTLAVSTPQIYYSWMAAMGRNLDLSAGFRDITINDAEINLGMGDLTLLAGNFTITNAAGLTIRARNFSPGGSFCRVAPGSDPCAASDNGLRVFASGNIELVSDFGNSAGAALRDSAGVFLRVELRADNDGDGMGMITSPTLTRGIAASSLFLQQAGPFDENLFLDTSRVSGAVTFRITAPMIDQTIHPWMAGLGGTDFSLRGVDGVTLDSITLPAALTYTGDIDLQATAITLTAATTLTGGAISLTGAITASNNLTITASGVLTLNSDINIGTNALTLTSGVGAIGATGRPRLTASTVSFSQVDALPVTRPFRFIPGSSLAITTEAPQDVHDWMIRENIDLTITSSNRVRVVAIIGSGDGAGRNLGTGSITLTSTGGTVRILANISISNNITLSGVTGGINLNSGAGAKTLSGAIVTISGDARSNRDLTITASGVLTLNSDINTGTSALSLSGSSVALGGALTLTGGAITLTGAAMGADSLTISASGTLTLNNNITLTSTTSILDLSGAGAIGDGSSTAVLTASTVRLRQVDAFGSMQSPFDFGNTGFLALTTDAAQDVHDWMILTDRNLTVTSSNRVRVMGAIGMDESDRNIGGGDLTLTSTGGAVRILGGISTTGDVTITASGTLTIDSDINIGANALTLTSGAGAIVATGRPRLTAGMVSFSQVDALPVTRPFRFSPGASLAITTEALQDVHDWMILEDIDLTVTSSNRVRVVAIIGTGGVAGRNLGTGALSLTSTGGAVRILDNITTGGNITLSGGAGGINLNGTATLTGAAITLTGDARGNRDLTLDASGTLRINSNITLVAGNLTLSSDTVVRILAGDISAGGNITLSAGTNGINLNNGAAAKTLSGVDIEITGDARSNRALTLTASGVLTLNGGINTGTSALSLSGSSVALGGALTLTGGDITLTGAATGTADLTLTASGILTLNNDIAIGANALTLTSGVGAIVATGRPRLTAGMVSFSQVDALPVTRPFRFIPGSSLAITTEAAQDVHDWMILENIDLTVTSSNRVRVVAIIGTGGVAGRNLGTGALSLTSTGGAVRILANISISNNITLSGVTDGINLNGTDTLSGAIITLTGDARGNRDLTITATGVLTINNNINIGTGALSLTGTSLTFGANVDLTAGDHIFDPTRTCDGSTADPTCTDTTP